MPADDNDRRQLYELGIGGGADINDSFIVFLE